MVDWEQIKIEYVTTNISQRKLAAKYEVPINTLSHRSTTEGWVEMRKQHRDKVVTETLTEIAAREAGRLERLMDTTSKAIDVAVKAFDDKDQFFRYLTERRVKYGLPQVDDEDDGAEEGLLPLISEKQWTEEKIFGKVDTKALKDMTAVLKDLTGLMRDFYNIPTPAQAEAQRIAAERLEMDKRKAEAASDDVSAIEVVFAAGPEEWNE